MALLFSVRDHVATIVLNRPEAMNAIDPETRKELEAACRRVDEDPDVRVAILTGAGERAFCTGADLKKTMPPKESFAELKFGRADDGSFGRFGSSKPLIAAVNGFALGGGLELALCCDILLASESARFGLPEVRIGSIPGAGGTQRLVRRIGWSDAMLMLLTGERIDAAEALRIGLVSRVTSPGQLMAEAEMIADAIAANAPLSVHAVKQLAGMGRELPLAHALELENLSFGVMRDTEDRIEGRVAFQEKRAPVYRGK